MKKVQSVSIPRTGHHLLVNCLNHYFGEDLKYCNFYGCCKTIGCPHGGNFQKNHDVPVHKAKMLPLLRTDEDMPYIVQYRRDAQSTLNAMYRNVYLKGLLGRENRPKGETSQYFAGQRDDFVRFCKGKRDYYHSFIQKWIVNNDNPQAYFLEYYDFLERPEHHLEHIIKIFDPDLYDREKLQNTIKAMDIRLRYNLQTCPLLIHNFNEKLDFVDPPKR